jgi:hypothetical protein
MLQQLSVLSNRTLPVGALDLDGLFEHWEKFSRAQNAQTQNREFLRERLRQTLAAEVPHDVIAKVDGQSIILGRISKQDRVPGLWIAGKGTPAIVLNPEGSSAALKTDVVRRLQREGRPILMPDLFQTGSAKAPRPGDIAVDLEPKLPKDADDEETADAAAGYSKFLTFNVSVDAARVQDILTAIVYAMQGHHEVEVFANGDAGVWAKFAVAICDLPVSLNVKDAPALTSNADYLRHFNVPGILRAGGLDAADSLVNLRKESPNHE